LRARGSAAGGSSLGTAPRSLLLNPFDTTDDSALVMSSVDGGSFELYQMNQPADQEPIRGTGVLAACFTARAKFALLDKASRHIIVRSFQANDAGKKVKAPFASPDFIFPASSSGRLLVRADDKIALFELQSRRVVGEIAGTAVKYVAWSADGSHVALIGKHAIVLCDRDLTQITSVTETVRIKSGCWDENGVFLYTTLNHVKYLLPLAPAAAPAGAPASAGSAADHGIVRTLDAPLYAVECRNGSLYVLDRDAKTRVLPVDTTEYQFKLALARRQFDRVLSIIKQSRLCGQAVIAYLQKGGFPEIALFFVEDEPTRFNLALECGNLDIALKAAKQVDQPETWHRLAAEALRQGNVEIAEIAYQCVKALDKLSFLYVITGNRAKLAKMLQISTVRNDLQSRLHNALYLGAVEDRIAVLEAAGQTALAYATASTFGLEEEAQRLRGYLEEAGLPVPQLPLASATAPAEALLPPTPLVRAAGNWPASPVSKGAFDPATIAAVAAAAKEGATGPGGAMAGAAAAASAVAAAQAAATAQAAAEARAAAQAEAAEDGDLGEEEGGEGGGWGDDLDLGLGAEEAKPAAAGTAGKSEGAWGDDLDLDLDGADLSPAGAASSSGKMGAEWTAPVGGTSIPSYWVGNSSVAGDHVAAGSFETAMQLLNRQIGIVNFAPLRANFISAWQAARTAVSTLPSLPSATVFLSRNDLDAPLPRDRALPVVGFTLATLQERVRNLYRAFMEGKFSECKEHLDALFAAIPLVVIPSGAKAELAEVKAILRIALEYKLAVRIMLTAKAHDQEDGVRQMELASYMAHCALEPPHLILALNLAMSVCYKFQNFIHAAGFARRLLEMPDISSAKNAALATKAKKVLQLSEQQARNAHKIDYDPAQPFTICAGSLTPIYKGVESIVSPFSGAVYLPRFKGSVCAIDGMSAVGIETLGLVCSNVQTRK
jgi:coatomer protein complex subunit alpha (xenin)